MPIATVRGTTLYYETRESRWARAGAGFHRGRNEAVAGEPRRALGQRLQLSEGGHMFLVQDKSAHQEIVAFLSQ